MTMTPEAMHWMLLGGSLVNAVYAVVHAICRDWWMVRFSAGVAAFCLFAAAL